MSDLPGIDLQDCADFLNNLLESDRETVRSMLINEHPISEDTALNHPYIQCRDTDDGYGVALVGFLNGLFEADDYRLGVNLDYPDLDDDATDSELRKAYHGGNFEIVAFKVLDWSDLTACDDDE